MRIAYFREGIMVKFKKPSEKEKGNKKSQSTYTPQHKQDVSHLAGQENSFRAHQKNYSAPSLKRTNTPRGNNS